MHQMKVSKLTILKCS